MTPKWRWCGRCLTLLFLFLLTELQEHASDSGAGVSGEATQLRQVWGRPIRGEPWQLPGGADRPAVRTHAGIHQAQQTV